MGGSSSKVTTPVAAAPAAPSILEKGATVSLETAKAVQEEAQKQAQEALKQAQNAAAATVAALRKQSQWKTIAIGVFIVAVVAVGILFLYQYIAGQTGLPVIPGFPSIHSAKYGNTDVTSTVTNFIGSNGVLTIPASLSQTLNVPNPKDSTNPPPLTITYQFPNDSVRVASFADTQTVVISSTSKPGDPVPSSSRAPMSAPKPATQPSLMSRIWSSLTGAGGGSSGNLIPSLHDATTSSIVQATSAPLSSQDQGAYGMQWWMFVKDWNYGYGKDKPVLTRPDPTSATVSNPAVSLHPTENTLKVTISLFPSGDGTAASTPAPAGSSGASTDDVYVCEVANIPLQTWFSVGVTIFGRNLDVYIDGKLVKSCFLPGVPKPAVGDIQLSPGGGFSGYMCDYYHYPRMLTPGDAMNFYSGGTSCKNSVPADGTAPGSSAATGYSVKFGVYNTLGKEVQEYTF